MTEHLSLRDLLSHQGGFPGNLYKGAKLFKYAGRTVDELVDGLGSTDLTFPFRTRFNYDNIGYAIAGEVVAKVSGHSWAEFCQEKFFTPLDMSRTTISYSQFSQDENSASPHTYQIQEPIPGYDWEKDHMEAASGINSCAQDMAKWLHYCLNYPSIFHEMHQPYIIINPEDMVPETELPVFPMISHGTPFMHYGLGWWMYNLESTTVYRHTGSSHGMQSVLAIIPEKQIGIVILNNQSKIPAMSCFINQLLDRLIGRPETDWHKLGLKAYAEAEENEQKILEIPQTGCNEATPLHQL